MTDHYDHIKKRLEDYNTKKLEKTSRKRRLPHILFLVNIMALVGLIYFFQKSPQKVYSSKSIAVNEVQYRVSATIDEFENDLIASISFEAPSNLGTIINLAEHIAVIRIASNGKFITEKVIGKGKEQIRFNAGTYEASTARVPAFLFESFIKKNALPRQNRKLADLLKKKSIPLNIEFIFSNKEKTKIGIKLDYPIK
jgi:hypothetical protein